MSRSPVSLRTATVDDVAWLVDIWGDALRRGDRATRRADLEQVVAAQDERSRLVVAELDGHPAGAVYLVQGTLSPLDLEPVVQTVAPYVLPEFRRRGVGRALVEAGVTFAEERGIARVTTTSASGARDTHRFLARIGLGSHSTLRVGPTMVVRARLEAARPPSGMRQPAGTRPIGQVLAVRRSLRRLGLDAVQPQRP